MADPVRAAGGPHRHAARVLEVDGLAEIARELERTASEPEGVALMTPKGRVYAVRLDDVPLKAAPLLKQELLAAGGIRRTPAGSPTTRSRRRRRSCSRRGPS
ncbi:hypothetical protein B2A_08245, partial [mine drainage metagenome]